MCVCVCFYAFACVYSDTFIQGCIYIYECVFRYFCVSRSQVCISSCSFSCLCVCLSCRILFISSLFFSLSCHGVFGIFSDGCKYQLCCPDAVNFMFLTSFMFRYNGVFGRLFHHFALYFIFFYFNASFQFVAGIGVPMCENSRAFVCHPLVHSMSVVLGTWLLFLIF